MRPAIDHFARDPHWTWFILFYFFFAGIAGGSYLIATLLRLRGDRADEPVARLGYYVTFIVLLCCPPLLIIDLGQPLRFWHMMWRLTPNEPGLNFKYWSPMSLGVWGLSLFSTFAAISFFEVLVRDDKLRLPIAKRAVALLDGGLGRVVNILGSIFGLFIAGYTGVLLSVSNQPIWSDTWTLGGLFLASGLSSATAVLTILSRYRRGAGATHEYLHLSESYFTVLEVVMLVLFVVSLRGTGALERTFTMPWLVLWAVAIASLIPGITGLFPSRARVAVSGHGSMDVTVHSGGAATAATMAFVLIGVICLRAAIILPVHAW